MLFIAVSTIQKGATPMPALSKKIFCVVLALCALPLVCTAGASDISKQDPSFRNIQDANSTTDSPMSSDIALNTNITKRGASWVQGAGYPAYRLWIDNTTNSLMTATITSPSGKKTSVSIASGSNKSIVNNNAEIGRYTILFRTTSNVLSGTVRVRISTTPIF